MPRRPTGDPDPIPVGDDAEDAGPALGPLAIPAQVPDAFPIVPPPSNVVVDPDVPVVPEKLPPMLEHVVMLPGAAPSGDVPDVIGLTPGDERSVAPMGMPVRGTAGAGPMPSGDVIPSGDPSGDGPIPPICAGAELLVTKTIVSAASDQRMNRSERVILMSSFADGNRPTGAQSASPAYALVSTTTDRKHPPDCDLTGIAAICPVLRRPEPVCDGSPTAAAAAHRRLR
jgi:hypothetical protein